MAMEYLIFNIDRKEYSALKQMETEIIEEANCERNAFWRERVMSLETGFCYEPEARCIGIFFNENGKKSLYPDSRTVIDEKEILAYNLRNSIVSRLRMMREEQGWIC